MLDILITTYNSEKTIFSTLASIIIQKTAPLLDITIVDDGSENPIYIGGDLLEFKKKLNELNLWFPVTKFDIPKTMREFASNFNQEKFDKMASELLTSKGNI